MSDIQERNQKFLNNLQGNFGKYVSFLSTMARFHKYNVADLTSFAIEAPAMFTAVANKELWERHFRRKIKPNAKGLTLIKDGKETVYKIISEGLANRTDIDEKSKKLLVLSVESVILERMGFST